MLNDRPSFFSGADLLLGTIGLCKRWRFSRLRAALLPYACDLPTVLELRGTIHCRKNGLKR